MNTIKVGKLEAARRQIDTAIDLWFHDGDPISIHTLVSAGDAILADLVKHAGDTVLRPEHTVEQSQRGKVLTKLRSASHFFKHAKKDASHVMEFKPEYNELVLYMAIHSFRGLSGTDGTLLMRAFSVCFAMQAPEFAATFTKDERDDVEKMLVHGKRHFLEEFYRAASLGIEL